MSTYLLFLDTETSDIPTKWDVEYSNTKNWPSAIQVAWVIYDVSGKEIKRVNKYINENDITISPKSGQVHGIDKDYLQTHGIRRKDVLRKLSYDLKKYTPLVIGHFIELDIHILSADYYRAKLKNPFLHLSFFCTMIHSRTCISSHNQSAFRLYQLFQYLFDEIPAQLHEAEHDAELTAKCFLELRRRQGIQPQDYDYQEQYIKKKLNFATVAKKG